MSASRARASGERLQKVLAHAGIASRRRCEEFIVAGRVKVNGRVVTELGTRVDPGRDRIEFDDLPLHALGQRRYYKMYKPVGYLCTTHDPQGRPTVLDLVPSERRLYPVGRLDLESEGLSLVTDDGDLTQRLLHPRYGCEREYAVLVDGHLTESALALVRNGVLLDGEKRPAQASVWPMDWRWAWRGERAPKGRQWLRVVLKEGRKRQIRRTLDTLGHRAKRIIRVRMAGLHLGDLKPGDGQWLGEAEVLELRRSAYLNGG